MRWPLPYIGDMIAIPLFLWLAVYFYKKESKTLEEKGLFAFAVGGLVADILFVTRTLT
jgi:hypothetical protein